MSRPRRKDIRLGHYNYGQAGCYFVTICTKGKSHIFGEILSEYVGNTPPCVGAGISRPHMNLSPLGEIVDETIKNIPKIYDHIDLDCYVVMPNHVHLLLTINHISATSNPTTKFIII